MANIPLDYRPKYIEGYEGEYGVCRAGYVFSFKKWKFLKGGKSREYKNVQFYKNGKSKSYWVHRLVALAFIPNPNNLPEVNHKDENPSNNAVWNLEWCTHKYNSNYGTRNDRIGNALRGVNSPCYGKHLSEQHRKKLSVIKKGKPSPNKGKCFTDEHKRKLSMTAKKLRGKKVAMINKDTGEIILIFDCVVDANEYMGKRKDNDSIGLCARGKRKTCYGYKWAYIEEAV